MVPSYTTTRILPPREISVEYQDTHINTALIYLYHIRIAVKNTDYHLNAYTKGRESRGLNTTLSA